MTLRSVWVSMQRQQRAHARRGQRGKNGDGVDVAFVEDAEHEIDRRQSRGNQVGLAAERILIGLRGAGEHGLDGGRKADLAGRLSDGLDGIAQRDAGLQVERDGDRREQALVVHRERRDGRTVMGDGAQGNLLAAGRAHIDVAQGLRVLPVPRGGLHHHVILVQRLVHGRDLALAEGVVQRVVDQLRRDAEARGGLAVVGDQGLQAAVLLVAVDVDDDGDGFQLLEHAGRVSDQILQVVAAHGELVLRGAVPSADAQVLGGLQVEGRAGNPGELRAQALHDVIDRDLALRERLERDEHARLVQGGCAAAPAAAAREAVDGVHRGIGGHDVHHLQQGLVHGLKRRVLVGVNLAAHAPVVLLRKESLGHANEQVHVQADGGQQDQQGRKRMAEHQRERLAV